MISGIKIFEGINAQNLEEKIFKQDFLEETIN
jgi:hypothetical protein